MHTHTHHFHGDIVLTGEDKDSGGSGEGAQQESKRGDILTGGVKGGVRRLVRLIRCRLVTRDERVDDTISYKWEENPARKR